MPHWVEWWLPSPTQRCDGFILAFLHNNQQSPSITQCFGLWQCQFWFDSWFEDKTSFCWVLPLYYSNEIFCTVHHQTLPTFFIKWSILCCQMLIKTFWIQNQNRHSSAGVGWRNWVFSSCSPWGANFSLLWHYSEVGWLERSSHQQPTICTTFQEWPKSLSKIIFHTNFVEKFVCQKVELLCVSNSLMSTRVPYFA